jgi:hypothetical protein
MIIYLDQNKWIELSRIYYGKEKDKIKRSNLLHIQEAVREGKILLPLSAIHYLETAKISRPEQRARLGEFMFLFSQGYTLASYKEIVEYELEVSLSKLLPSISPRQFDLIGRGIDFAMGGECPTDVPEIFNELIEQSLLSGKRLDGSFEKAFKYPKYREEFRDFLEQLPSLVDRVSSEKVKDALNAISLAGIAEPVYNVFTKFNLSPEIIRSFGKDGLIGFASDMPTRTIDIHMCSQIIKNPKLKPKDSDLEDWAGLGPAVQYCDVVVCENHYADLATRGNFKTKAKILTNIAELVEILPD